MVESQELEHRLKLRTIKLSDYEEIKEIMNMVYAKVGGAWTRKELNKPAKGFP